MARAAPSGRIEDLVEEHYPALYRYAFRLAGTAAEAEDLTQETFFQGQVKLGQLRDWAKARNWLFTILRNLYLHKIRGGKGEQLASPELLQELPDRVPAPLPDIDPQQLQVALNELPEAFRTPIILFYFEDFSYRDIAEHLEAPIGTVMSRLARAKAFLRSRLTPALAVFREEET